MTTHQLPPDDSDAVPLESCPDPVTAVLEAYRAGRTVSVLTSGTTGLPRRIVRTAASWVDSFSAVAELAGITSDSRAWLPGPLTATMNLYAAALVAHLGVARVESVSAATHAFVTPTGLLGLLAEPVAVAGLHVIVAGDRLPVGLADRAEGRGWTVSHYYGAAQLSFVAWGRDEASLRPFPEVQVEIRDGAGSGGDNLAGPHTGEIWVSSPWLCEREVTPRVYTRAVSAIGTAPNGGPMLRTWRDPETAERWATVGDRGRITPGGRLLVAGRHDVILTGGVTVIIADAEAVLRSAARGEVYLVGQPHDRLGAVVVAVCTDAADLEGLPGYARVSLGTASRPRRWLHRPDLPRTAAGKVDRAALAIWASQAGKTGSHVRAPRLLPG